MSKDGTQAEGWHEDFASDRPEHARRQSLRPQVEQAKQAIAELPESVRANAHMEGCHHEGFASPTGPDTRQEDEDRWRTIAEEMPAPHARYRVYRKGIGDGFFDATPCYGMHSPWWVPRNAFTKEESPPAEMQKTDLWQPLPQPPESES